MSKKLGYFFKILWPSQNIWTLHEQKVFYSVYYHTHVLCLTLQETFVNLSFYSSKNKIEATSTRHLRILFHFTFLKSQNQNEKKYIYQKSVVPHLALLIFFFKFICVSSSHGLGRFWYSRPWTLLLRWSFGWRVGGVKGAILNYRAPSIVWIWSGNL